MADKAISPRSTLADIEDIMETIKKVLAMASKSAGGSITYDEDKMKETIIGKAAELAGMSVEEWMEKRGQQPEPEPELPPEPTPIVNKPAAVRRLRKNNLDDEPYFWVNPKDEKALADMLTLRKSSGLVMSVLNTGPSGAGKTTLFARLAKQYGMPFYKVDCASITTVEDWVGHKEVVSDEKGTRTEYHLSQFLRWVGGIDCEPGLVLLDELNRLHPQYLNVAIPILDGSREVWVPELGIKSPVHPDTVICATANLGASFHGTFPLDVALSYRFGFRLETTFPPVEEEVTVLRRRTGITERQARLLVGIADKQRSQVGSNFDQPVSTRNLLDCAALMAIGYSIPDAAEYTFLRLFSEDGGTSSERARLRVLLSGKVGGKAAA